MQENTESLIISLHYLWSLNIKTTLAQCLMNYLILCVRIAFDVAKFRLTEVYFNEARDAAPCADGAGGGCGHAAKQLEEGALAGAVTPDDSHDVALFHLEVDVLEDPHVFAVALVCAVVDFAHLEVGVLAAQHLGLPEPVQVVAERPGAH